MKLPKASFSNYWGNYFAALLVGFLSFLAASFTFAGESDWTEGYYWSTAGNRASTPIESCQMYAAQQGWSYDHMVQHTSSAYTCYARTGGGSLFTASTDRSACNGSTASYCQEPLPPEPENCTDLQGDTWNVTITEGYASTESCNKGCSGTISGLSVTIYPFTQQYTYSGLSCPGGTGYDSTASGGSPSYDPEAPPKVCKDANGYVYGSVSANAECPTRQNCYDENKQLTATASGSANCPTGSAPNATWDYEFNVTAEQSTSTTTSADGSTETETTTTETHTGGDGKSYTTTTTNSQSCDSAQNCTSTTSTATGFDDCQGEDCPAAPSVGDDVGDCGEPLQCTGDVHECAQLSLLRQQMCQGTESSVQSALQQAAQDGDLSGTDENGRLTDIEEETVDLGDYFDIGSMLADNGNAGSCPAPVTMSLLGQSIEFTYDTICEYMEGIRPLVIFSAGFLCLLMFNRSVLEISHR